MAPSVQASVVSYRTPDLLTQCLDALDGERRRSGCELCVTVVDNGSADGSAELVADRYPGVRLIQNADNRGFGAAHNQALRGCLADYAFILNSDAVVRPGAISHLVACLEARPDAAVAGPRLRYPDGSTQPSRRRFPTPATFFLESTQLQRFWPRNRVLDRYYVTDQSADQEQDVDWLVGAALLVRVRAIQQVGLFDERYFMYSEELDLCRRFRAAGWRVRYCPGAEVQHQEGASSQRDLLAREIRFQTSKLRYVRKWHGSRLAALLRGYLLLEFSGRAVEESAKAMLGSQAAERRARLRVILGYLRAAPGA